MPTEKRQRKKEGHQARKAAALAAARRQQRKRRLITAVAVALVVVLVMALVSFLSGDDDDETDVAAEGSTTTTAVADEECPPPVEAEGKPEVELPDAPATELGIRDITVGDGAEAKLGDSVEVHYVGVQQSNGCEFDTSWGGEPAKFDLLEGALIQGWIDGIPGMKVGGRRELVIPESLAYRGGDPSGTLVFVVDLVSVS